MEIFYSTQEVPAGYGPTVATIGNFDGVHRGHAQIIAEIICRARAIGAKSVAITFDPHPVRVLRPQSATKFITPLSEKLCLLGATGLDAVLVVPFTQELSRMSAQAFAESILVNTLHAVEVHEGENFRFGRDAGTGVHGLEELGHLIGFKVCVYGPQKIRGQVISSSRVRQLIAEGHVEQARALLGRPFAIQGTPAPGRGYGSLYTVPTINFAPYADLLPANGVYITLLEIGAGAEARTFESVTNAGNRPTFGADPFTVETHILDFQPVTLSEITPLTLTFMKRLRGEHRFPTVADLREQIALDVQRARRYFHHYRWAVKHHPPAQQA